MESGQGNNQHSQNVKVVLPPRPDKKKTLSQPVSEDTHPVRVTIPPRQDRKTVSPQSAQVSQNNQGISPSSQNAAGVTALQHTGRINTSKGSAAKAELSFEQLAQLASSVVMIMVHDSAGESFAFGSGIMIGRKGYILTNNHVLSDGSFFSVRIENDDNCYRTNQVIKYNDVLDLAVIRIDKPLVPLPIYKGPQKLVRGQKVVAIGSPLGLFNSVSDGIISGFRNCDDVDMIQYTAPVSSGSSGGAILNMYGEVIGISTRGMRNAQNINLAVGYEFINLFIQGFTGS
ncbi:MAG: serine protease [Lachnospiraceae bacterium]